MKRTFSAFWTPELGRSIEENYDIHCNGLYFASLVGKDHLRVIRAVNQGIDAHLQACYVPARGDRYICGNGRLECHVSRESLPVLVRRLLEEGDDEGMSLASGICLTLNIELV